MMGCKHIKMGYQMRERMTKKIILHWEDEGKEEFNEFIENKSKYHYSSKNTLGDKPQG